MKANHEQAPVSNSAECYALGELRMPGEKELCSSSLEWTSLLVQIWNNPAISEAFEYSPSPDLSISILLAGEHEVESFSNGLWRKAAIRPGMGGLTSGGKTNRLRWHSQNRERPKILSIHIPQFYLDGAAEEFRRAGADFYRGSFDALAITSPVILQTGLALLKAVETGAPNLYAESAAQYLATHLLSLHSEWKTTVSEPRTPGLIADARLRRVLEFMEHHYSENLSLAELAREAGISRFHFVGLFKKACGVTPHQHLIELRLNAAGTLLRESNLGVKEIAKQCGYHSTAHFAVAFQKYFKQTPADYRKR